MGGGVKRRRSSLLMYEGSPIFWITLCMRGWGKGQIAFLVPSLRVSLKPTAVSFSLVRLAFPFDDNSLVFLLGRSPPLCSVYGFSIYF